MSYQPGLYSRLYGNICFSEKTELFVLFFVHVGRHFLDSIQTPDFKMSCYPRIVRSTNDSSYIVCPDTSSNFPSFFLVLTFCVPTLNVLLFLLSLLGFRWLTTIEEALSLLLPDLGVRNSMINAVAGNITDSSLAIRVRAIRLDLKRNSLPRRS